MQIEIRRLRANDMEELMSFFRTVSIDTFEKNGISHLTDDLEDELHTKERYLQEDLYTNGQQRYFLLAIHEGKIVGTIGLYKANSFVVELTKGDVQGMDEVGTIYILPSYQNKGLSTLLIKAMMLTLKANGITQFCLDSGFATAQAVCLKKFGQPTYLFEHCWGKEAHHMVWIIQTDHVPVTFTL